MVRPAPRLTLRLPKIGPDEQDKRSVIPIELEDVDTWLHGTQAEASKRLRLADAEVFKGGAV